jgi:hypothetical protein
MSNITSANEKAALRIMTDRHLVVLQEPTHRRKVFRSSHDAQDLNGSSYNVDVLVSKRLHGNSANSLTETWPHSVLFCDELAQESQVYPGALRLGPPIETGSMRAIPEKPRPLWRPAGQSTPFR